MGLHFSKVRGHGHIGPPQTKKSGAQAPPAPPGSDAYAGAATHITWMKTVRSGHWLAYVSDKAGNLVVNDSDKANLFDKYFSTVGVADNGVIPSHVNPLTEVLFVMQSVNWRVTYLVDLPDYHPCYLSSYNTVWLNHCLWFLRSCFLYLKYPMTGNVPVFKKGAINDVL